MYRGDQNQSVPNKVLSPQVTAGILLLIYLADFIYVMVNVEDDSTSLALCLQPAVNIVSMVSESCRAEYASEEL